jgi:hypothetical protein
MIILGVNLVLAGGFLIVVGCCLMAAGFAILH